MKNFQNKKICVLGLGVENYALLKYLQTGKNKLTIENIEITICDSRSMLQSEDRLADLEMDFKLKLGKGYDKDLDKYDVILRSPGYPLFTDEIKKARKKGVLITSAMQMFMDNCPTKNVIGVTGSKGKGTTSSLIYEIIKRSLTPSSSPLKRGRKSPLKRGVAGGRGVFLGGNIGTAPFEFFDKIKKDDWVVLELSSFQLEDLKARFKIAVITNLFKEHLSPADPNNPNYHKSMKTYWDAKANIFKYQTKNDHFVVNEKLKNKICHSDDLFSCHSDDQREEEYNNISFTIVQDNEKGVGQKDKCGKVTFYTKSELSSKLTGEYNKENIAAAVEVAKILRIKKDIIEKAVAYFKGLPHRLEKVAKINGVEYYDDSFATVPEGSVLALRSFSNCHSEGAKATEESKNRSFTSVQDDKKRIILLAGGADKGADFKEFAREINKRVKHLILFKGEGSKRLKEALKIEDCKLKIDEVESMQEAMKIAKDKSEPNDVVLLSTGCASFGVFKNYKERGNQFKEEVKK